METPKIPKPLNPNQDAGEMAEVKKFNADAKFSDVKKYQEDIEVLLKGIDDEVCVLVHRLTFIMSQAYGTPCTVCEHVHESGWRLRHHARASRSFSKTHVPVLLRIKQQKQLKNYVKGEPGPHGNAVP